MWPKATTFLGKFIIYLGGAGLGPIKSATNNNNNKTTTKTTTLYYNNNNNTTTRRKKKGNVIKNAFITFYLAREVTRCCRYMDHSF